MIKFGIKSVKSHLSKIDFGKHHNHFPAHPELVEGFSQRLAFRYASTGDYVPRVLRQAQDERNFGAILVSESSVTSIYFDRLACLKIVILTYLGQQCREVILAQLLTAIFFASW